MNPQKLWQGTIYALQFLTVIPLGTPATREPRSQDIAGFSFAGIIIGLMWAIVAQMSILFFPPIIAAAIVLLVDLVLTGGLHLDGVSDIGDGLAAKRSGADPNKAMKDSAIGGVGSALQTTVLIMRFACFYVFLQRLNPLALAAIPFFSRTLIPTFLRDVPIRPNGLGAFFAKANTPFVSTSCLLISAAAIIPWFPKSLGLASISWLVALAVVRLSVRAIGKHLQAGSGDLIGFGIVFSELLAMFAFIFLVS